MPLALIAAATSTGVIGNRGMLPWRRQSADMAFFRKTTRGAPVIMGRTTYESLPEAVRPLPGRPNIILTRQEKYPVAEGVVVLADSNEVLDHVAHHYPKETAFVIGGGEVYRAFLPHAETVYLTEIEADLPGDTWFPVLDPTEWQVESEQRHPADAENEFPMVFRTYVRR